MINKEDILKEADYYLENNVTMEQAADHFQMCKKTFQLHMKKLEEICDDKFKLVQDKKERNLIQGMSKGGKNGKPGERQVFKPFTLTEVEAQELARQMLLNDWGFRDAEKYSGIPKTTIADNLSESRIGSSLYKEFSQMLESHKPGNRK